MTKVKWIVLGITVPIILALLGLGFQAMSTNPPVQAWVPPLFFALAGLVTAALIVYLLWNLIMRVRFQQPIILIDQHSETKTVSKTTIVNQYIPRRLEHDGVLWEDGGNDWGHIDVIGPLCPKDYTPLATKDYRGSIINHAKFDADISDIPDHLGYHHYFKLVCPECKTEYTLGNNPKKLQDSHDEVRLRFEGKRRREQQT